MRKFTFFIALMLSLSAWAFHDFKSGDCYYNIISNTPPYTVRVAQGWGIWNGSWYAIKYSGDIVIPDSVVYNNICYSVISIDNLIFYDCPALTSVKVGNNIQYIGKHYFANNPRLKKVVLPESLTTISDEAFIQCDSLHTINIPSSLTTVGKNLFGDCPLLDTVIWNLRDASLDVKPLYNNDNISYVIIGDSVTTIGKSAFSSCSNLQTVEWGRNLKIIGESAFSNTGLRSVILPEGVDSIAHGAFYSCDSLQVVSIPSSVRRIFERANSNNAPFRDCHTIDSIYWNANQCPDLPFTYIYTKGIQVVEFGDSIKHIPNNFCEKFDSLKTVIFPTTLQSIGNNAFNSCKKLTSIVISDSVTTIGKSAFSSCSNLDTVKVLASIPPTLGNNAFTNSPICLIPCGMFDVYQNSIWKSQMGNIEEMCDLRDGTSCEAAIPIHWQDSIELDGNADIWYQVDIARAITSGKDLVWRIHNPHMPGFGVDCSETLLMEVYSDCTDSEPIYSVQIDALCPSERHTEKFDFEEYLKEAKETIYVHFVSNGFYYATQFVLSADFATNTELEDNCDEIQTYVIGESNGLFSDNQFTPTDDWYGLDFTNFKNSGTRCYLHINNTSSDVIEVSLDFYESCSSVETIFSYSDTLEPNTNVVLPFDYTPYDIAYLHAVSTGDVLIEWIIGNKCGDNLYWDYENEHLTITGYGDMYDYIFLFDMAPWSSFPIKQISLPDNLTSIGAWAFSMQEITSINIPSSVTKIGGWAFSFCPELQSINIPESVISIGETSTELLYGGSPFVGCYSLSSITVEEGNANYDSRENCNAIIHTVSNSLIAGCRNTIIPENITKIGSWAFSGGLGDEEDRLIIPGYLDTMHYAITIPKKVKSIGEGAFMYSYFDTLYVEAINPPTIDSTTFNTNPTCYVPCGTHEIYQSSEWRNFMGAINTINQTEYFEETIVACDSYDWNGQTYTESGDYVYTTIAANNCDSIVTLHLTINQIKYAEESVVTCDSYTWNGETYTASGDYTYTTVAANGCDSIVTLYLTINATKYAEETATACDSYNWNGKTYTESGDYVYTTVAANGCDSIVTIHLTINNSEMGKTEYVTICYGETYTWNGQTYAATGEYSVTLTNAAGCDSVATLQLTIMPEAVTTTETVVIGSDELPYTWRDNTYSATGRYTVVEQYTTAACDSVIYVLDLTVLTAGNHDEQSVTICDSEVPYLWYGESYTATGKYTYTEKYVGTDIDSIRHILNLMVNSTVNTEESVTACDSYEWNGETYTQSGEYTYTTTAANGCDSIVTLHLTINKSEHVEFSMTACDSYEWHGLTYTMSGDYMYNTTTASGCEHVETLHLTILPKATTERENLALCPSELPYEWYGQLLTAAGSYSTTEQYAGMECDSVIHELTLDVYVQTLPVTVTLPIVRTGEAIDVTIPTAEIQAHIAAETWYAPNAEVAWYIMDNSDWGTLTDEPVAAGIKEVILKYAVKTDCGNVESNNMVIAIEPTGVANTNSPSPISNCQKILYEDHIYILRDGKIYSVMGQEL